MPSSVWKGSIVLSLVSIPVKLFAAARRERTFLHQLHSVCHSRLSQPLFCPTCERFVKRDEIVKGYEVKEGQYVLVQGEEIKKIAVKSSRLLQILQPFQPAQYHDEFQDRLRKLVEAKRRGQTVEVEESVKRAPVTDMMEALKKSLASRTAAGAEAKRLPAKRKTPARVKKAS